MRPDSSDRVRLIAQLDQLRATQEDAVDALARSLPHIIPNVLLGQRDVSGCLMVWVVTLDLDIESRKMSRSGDLALDLDLERF